MKIYLLIILTLLFSGCATYDKRIQLSPQKTAGWEKGSPDRYKYECKEGEVEVGPIVLGYESKGDFNFFIPIPDSQEEVRKANEGDAGFYVQFRYANPIESCNLSYVSLADQSSGNWIAPKSAMDIPSTGTYKGKYTHGCLYSFDIDQTTESDYMLYISEGVLNCAISPILFKKEKSFDFRPTELL